MRKLRPRKAGRPCSPGCLPATTPRPPAGVWFGWRISQPPCHGNGTQWNTRRPLTGACPGGPPSSKPASDIGHAQQDACVSSSHFQPHRADNMSGSVAATGSWCGLPLPTPTPLHGDEPTPLYHHSIFPWPVCSPLPQGS